MGRCGQLRAEVDLPPGGFSMVSLVRGSENRSAPPERSDGAPVMWVGRGVVAPGGAPISGRNCSFLPKVGRFIPSFRVCLAHEAGIVVDVFERFARALGHAEEGIFCHVEGDVDFVR